MGELLTIKETAAALKVSSWTIRRWLNTKDITAVRLGRSIRISRSEIERIMTKGISLS